MYDHMYSIHHFVFILIRVKQAPFQIKKRKREKACDHLFPIFFSSFFLSITFTSVKHMKRRQNVEVAIYISLYYIPALYTERIHHHQKMNHDMTQCVDASTSPKF